MYWVKLLAKIIGGLFGLLVVLIVIVMLSPTYTTQTQIDFTRHLSQHAQAAETAAPHQESFFGVAGSARLIITSAGEGASGTILLNGTEVAGPDSFSAGAQFEVSVDLVKDNTISVVSSGLPDSSFSVRIKQIADMELHVLSRIHFNTNVSNWTEARKFYGDIGFETVSGFPDTNTHAMARAIGIETPTPYDGSQGDFAGGYLLHGEIVGLGGFTKGVIDLIEFTIPRENEAPYAQTNHLGMARGAMFTTNIDADYDYMTGIGVNFLSPPATRADGNKFAIFTDLDGTFYELVEVEGEDSDDESQTETTHITRMGQLTINVSDFERSAAWYQMMGYNVSRKLPRTDTLEVAKAMGFDAPFEWDGAMFDHDNDNSILELVQWITPYDPERAYPVPVNHFGIHRTAFASADIEADVAALRAQGVEFISPITPCCSGDDASSYIVAFYDPDGTIVELAGSPLMSKIYTVMQWFAD